MKIAELRAKDKTELKDLVLSLKKEQFNLRMQEATGALTNKGRFKEVRRTIARAKMLLSNPGEGRSPVAKPTKAKAAGTKTTKTKNQTPRQARGGEKE